MTNNTILEYFSKQEIEQINENDAFTKYCQFVGSYDYYMFDLFCKCWYDAKKVP